MKRQSERKAARYVDRLGIVIGIQQIGFERAVSPEIQLYILWRSIVRFGVVELQAGENGVIKAHIQTFGGKDNGLGFVSLKRGGDGDIVLGVAIKHIDQILLFNCTYT